MGKPQDAKQAKKPYVNPISRIGDKAAKGRPKGVPNKVTTEFRQTVTALLQSNSENVGIWLGQVAQDDPYKALDMLAKLAEYATPKLARQEHVGENGGAMKFELSAPWLERIVQERGLV